MSAPAPTVDPELKALMRRLKLGRLIDTLPERLALARTDNLTHAQLLEQLFCDEVQRRDADSAGLRARTTKLDPTMTLEAWDDTAAITSDRAVWAELVSMRFVDQARNAFILGPVGRRQDLPGHSTRPHRLPASHRRALRTGRPNAQAPQGRPPRRQLRRRDAQAHRRRPPPHR